MSDQPLDDLLAGLEDDGGAADFVRRVIRRVDRRQMTADFIGFGWEMPQTVALEAAKAAASLPEIVRAALNRPRATGEKP